MYLGVETTLSSKKYSKKLNIGLTKKQLYQLKTILINNLVEFQQKPDELKRYLAGQTVVYQVNNRLKYVTLEFDMERAKFMVENGKQLFRHAKHEEAIVQQHQRSLKKNLDFVILGILYQSLTGKEVDIEGMHRAKRGDPFMPMHAELTNSVESISKLYRLNKALITYLRDQIIASIQPLFKGQGGVRIDKQRFRDIIRQKIGVLIEGLYIKHPDSHQRVASIH